MKNILIAVLIVVFTYGEECIYRFQNKQHKIETKTFLANDIFGCEYENRDIQEYNDKIKLKMNLNNNEDRILMYFNGQEFKLFDIWSYSAPETPKVIDIAYIKNKKIIFLLNGFTAYIEEGSNIVGVSAAFYDVSLYRLFNSFPLKIQLSENIQKSFNGIDGFYYGERKKYLYKTHDAFLKKTNSIKITDDLILSSLEIFVNSNYSEKYDSKFAFKDSSFDLEALKAILNDIQISKKTLTTYNDIAYYLQKAGANEEAIYLLEKIIEKFPNRTVAHYNLADAYWEFGEKKKAIESYKTYIEQMKANGKAKKIPQMVLDRVSTKL